MGQFVVPVLLLATVALSSSNVLPATLNRLHRETLGLDSQYNDSIFRNRYQTRNILDEIYKIYFAEEEKPAPSKLKHLYADPDNNRDDILSILNKNDNYNGEGFRKEQWHNYPRQLDRLHKFYEENIEKRNFEHDLSKELYPEEVVPESPDVNEITNEFHQTNTGTNNIYDAVITTDPLLILKIRLACLNKDNNVPYVKLMTTELENNNLREEENNEQFRNDNPAVNIVKREGDLSLQDNGLTDNSQIENKSVNKRIFSLWSRLQSLNHKGHELQHRRHLHAYYGLPDSEGGGILTAETRATLMRPPGSPLRWG